MEKPLTYWNNPRVRRRRTHGEIALNLDNHFVVVDERIDAVWRAAATPGTPAQLRDRTAELLRVDHAHASVITRAALDSLIPEGFIVSVSEEYVALYQAEPWAAPT